MTIPRHNRARAAFAAMLLLWLSLVACRGKQKEAQIREERIRAAAAVQGLDTIPADVRVVVGLNVPRLAASPLVQRKVKDLLARSPEAQAMLAGLLGRCEIDPARDLESVLLALGDSPEDGKRDSLLVARGKLDEAKLVACVTQSATEKGGRVDTREQNGMTLHAVRGGAGEETIYFTFGAPDTVLVAQREALLIKARDPAVPKIKGDAAMMALIGGADTRAALWGAGRMTPEVGSGLVHVAGGAVKAPAEAIFGHIDLADGVTAELDLTFASGDDAKGLAQFVKTQLKSYTVIAQNYDLGAALSHLKSEAHDKVFRLSITIDAKDMQKIEDLITEQIGRRTAKGRAGDAGI